MQDCHRAQSVTLACGPYGRHFIPSNMSSCSLWLVLMARLAIVLLGRMQSTLRMCARIEPLSLEHLVFAEYPATAPTLVGSLNSKREGFAGILASYLKDLDPRDRGLLVICWT